MTRQEIVEAKRDLESALATLALYGFKTGEHIAPTMLNDLQDAWGNLFEWAVRHDVADDTGLLKAARMLTGGLENLSSLEPQDFSIALALMRTQTSHVLNWLGTEAAKSRTGVDPETGEYGDERVRPGLARVEQRAADLAPIFAYISSRLEPLDLIRVEAAEVLVQAKDSARLASKAAADSSTNLLERSFQSTAIDETRRANGWRIATLGILGATAAIGCVFIFVPLPTATDALHELVYRVAVLSALGAVAAYTGRQAGQHRQIATWARGIEIQLKAFLGFVEEIRDEKARDQLYVLFGHRVLQAPPNGRTSDDSITNVIQPIIEQVVKRPS